MLELGDKYPVPTLRCLSLKTLGKCVVSVASADLDLIRLREELVSVETYLLRLGHELVDTVMDEIEDRLADRFRVELAIKGEREERARKVAVKQFWDWVWAWWKKREEWTRGAALESCCGLLAHPTRKRLHLHGLPSHLQCSAASGISSMASLQDVFFLQHPGTPIEANGETPISSRLEGVDWRCLPNLTSVSMIRCCSDSILRQLWSHCPMLESLDISLSAGVTQHGLMGMAWMKHLKKVCVSGIRSLPGPSYMARLLLAVPGPMRDYRELTPELAREIVQAAGEGWGPEPGSCPGTRVPEEDIKLTFTTISTWSLFQPKELIDLLRHCPELTSLQVVLTTAPVVPPRADEPPPLCEEDKLCRVLVTLPGITFLGIGGIRGQTLERLVTGSQWALTSLDLTGVAPPGLEWKQVCRVLRRCADTLSTLSVWEYPGAGWHQDSEEDGRGDADASETPPNTMPVLQNLFLSVFRTGVFALSYFLSSSPNLKELTLTSGEARLCHRRMRQALRAPASCANSLEKMEVIQTGVKARTARMLLRGCPNLIRLGVMSTWGMPDHHLDRIRRLILRHYPQIRLHSKDAING